MPEARIEIELDDGAVDALVACPETLGRKAPILLLPDRLGLTPEVESRARRLSAHNYFVLAPDLSGRPAEDRREAASACLDYLADERRVDDSRVGSPHRPAIRPGLGRRREAVSRDSTRPCRRWSGKRNSGEGPIRVLSWSRAFVPCCNGWRHGSCREGAPLRG